MHFVLCTSHLALNSNMRTVTVELGERQEMAHRLSPRPVTRTLRSVRVTSDTGDDNSEPPQLSLFASKVEGLPLVEPRITLEQCLESRALTDLQDRALGNRLNRMSLNIRTALSEQGVNVLFVAFGFLKWFEAEHSDESRLSPLLLVPVCLERIGATAP